MRDDFNVGAIRESPLPRATPMPSCEQQWTIKNRNAKTGRFPNRPYKTL